MHDRKLPDVGAMEPDEAEPWPCLVAFGYPVRTLQDALRERERRIRERGQVAGLNRRGRRERGGTA